MHKKVGKWFLNRATFCGLLVLSFKFTIFICTTKYAKQTMLQQFKQLAIELEGDLLFDEINLLAYSTDASAYQEKPVAIARPRSTADVQLLVGFAKTHQMPLIPRAAGTSLAGQVVGSGLVVDVSKYMTEIIEVNLAEGWVRVQPGVVRDELNLFLKPHGLFFGPETSTSNRCTVGGMLGNNACGAQSILYGSTRDHTLEVQAVLSDASLVHFGALSLSELEEKKQLTSLEGELYKGIDELLSNAENKKEIEEQFPKPEIYRRNTGYAIDLLLQTEPFCKTSKPFNFCKLLAGSEGTLAFTTEIKLNLVPLPPTEEAVLAVHFNTLDDALRANILCLKYQPSAVELMDDIIINCTKGHPEHEANRFFIDGEPEAVLMIQFERATREEIKRIAQELEGEMRAAGYGYHFPLIFAPDTKKVWNLRKAGLGLLANVKGTRRSTTVIEDTAVSPVDLPNYVRDFKAILKEHQLTCVFYAHVGSGELHLRPMLDLKNEGDLVLFRTIGTKIAHLVKKYRGSLSGEHGDGRLRGEFIPLMIGEHNYRLLQAVKQCWDPKQLFNPHKIVNALPMDKQLRLDHKLPTINYPTVFDFEADNGILGAAERCNGSGDCRKSSIIGGTMCPSFKATRDEQHTTRARANLLRQFITNSTQENPFDQKELYEVFDLCLLCKACKSECPSSVDVAKLKMEFLQQYYDANGVPLRSRLIANITKVNKLGALWPSLFNVLTQESWFNSLVMQSFGFSGQRSLPSLPNTTLEKWFRAEQARVSKLENPPKRKGKVYFFNDEFTNFADAEIGIQSVLVLERLGYEVVVTKPMESGRTYLSKGFVRKAKQLAIENIQYLSELITEETPLLGIEPSTILSFRDEYPDLIDKRIIRNKRYGMNLYEHTRRIAKYTFLLEEFLANEINEESIDPSLFATMPYQVKMHGHCQQKALSTTQSTLSMLRFLPNLEVSEIPSGCCGMAGSFGFEKEHYKVSMDIGEQVLFPAVKLAKKTAIIVASGTSCRHQITDGTGVRVVHPIHLWYRSLFDRKVLG